LRTLGSSVFHRQLWANGKLEALVLARDLARRLVWRSGAYSPHRPKAAMVMVVVVVMVMVAVIVSEVEVLGQVG
jgi:hypothetical protein